MTSIQYKIMQNTASGVHVARVNVHGVTSYDLINILEHIIQSAQHLTPYLCTAAARWAVIGRGEGTVVNTTYHVASGVTLTARPAAKESFCLLVRPNYSRMGNIVLLTLAPIVNLEERWDQAPVQVETDRATFSAVTASHVSLSLGDDGRAKEAVWGIYADKSELEDSDSLRGRSDSC